MSGSRAAILGKVRHALGRQAGEAPGSRPLPGGIVLMEAADLEQQLCACLATTGVTLEQLSGPGDLPAAVDAYRTRHGLESGIAIAPALKGLDWRDLPVEPGTALPHHRLAIGQAFAGLAATGSLVMLAGADSPARLNFLPEHHLVLLSRSRLLGRLEQLWPLLKGLDTEAVHLVTGPSSTADIGGHLLYGAHGPRALHVLLAP